MQFWGREGAAFLLLNNISMLLFGTEIFSVYCFVENKF